MRQENKVNDHLTWRNSVLEIVLAFFWYPDGPASPLEIESDSAMVDSRDLFRVGGTLAVVGMEGLRD